MKKLEWIFVSSSILVFYITFIFLVSNVHEWALFSTLVFTFFLGLIYYKPKNKILNRKLFICFISGICSIFLVAIFFEKNSAVRAIPYIFFVPTISFLTLALVKQKRLLKVLLFVPLCAFIGFVVFPNWFSLHQNFGSHIEETFPKVSFYDANDTIVNLSDDKVIVLDLWTTNCGLCFEKFPYFEEVYLKYESNSNVEFYSVNIPIKRDKLEKTKELVNRLGYRFPTIYSSEGNKIVSEKLNYYGYPQLLIIKRGKVYYKGQLVTNDLVYFHSIENEIERTLNI